MHGQTEWRGQGIKSFMKPEKVLFRDHLVSGSRVKPGPETACLFLVAGSHGSVPAPVLDAVESSPEDVGTGILDLLRLFLRYT